MYHLYIPNKLYITLIYPTTWEQKFRFFYLWRMNNNTKPNQIKSLLKTQKITIKLLRAVRNRAESSCSGQPWVCPGQRQITRFVASQVLVFYFLLMRLQMINESACLQSTVFIIEVYYIRCICIHTVYSPLLHCMTDFISILPHAETCHQFCM